MLYFALWKRIVVIGLCLLGLLFAAPNLLDKETRDSLPDWLPHDSVNLGLDLRGGAHLLVEVQVSEVVAERMLNLRSDAATALRDADIRRFTNLKAGDDFVSVRITNPEDLERARDALESLAQPVGGALGFAQGLGGPGLEVTDAGDQLLKIQMTEAAVVALTDRTISQSLEIVRRRIDESGTREPTIQRQGEDRILIQVPGIGSADELLDLIGRTAKLSFHAVEDFGPNVGAPGPGEYVVQGTEEEGGGSYLLERRSILTGDNLVDSQMGFHPDTGLPIVNFRFDTAGSRIFGRYTAANVGNLFAIVLDNQVISAPRIQSAILGGAGFIEGNFTLESATNLSILLRSGALPASIKILEQRTVGPDLGSDSVAAGASATLLAFAAVLVFMAISYGWFGILADLALIINVGLIFGILSLLGATLTLPGIAGIVLTIGMAVDANVLIFERINEELRASASKITRAVERGYSQALSAIVDANITTLIAALILFGIGSGPVKGFAVTLGVGIITSVFTAVMVTRLMVVSWLNWKRPKTLKIVKFKLVPEITKIDFMAIRRIPIVSSIVMVIAAIAVTFTMGMNFGIDFRGGTMVEIQTQEAADLGQIRSIVTGMDLGDVAVQSFGSERDVLVRIEEQRGDGDDQMAVADQIGETLLAEIPGTEVRRVEVVGPKVSGELLEAGILAVGLAVIAVLFYIWLRFEWQFGLSAVVALVHDVLLTIGVFAISGIEFNLAIIAAILTIVGYSLNDTVVVFDRIRENLRKYKKMSLIELLNMSVNETLSRTVMTSFTTLVALVAMFLLGPAVIQGFTFAMIWGIVIGTYSSIFIAAATLFWLGVKRDWKTDEERKVNVRADGAQV
ncbi:protein translocase subunit SecD [Rhodobacteraceae bacterium NNCM2]|nr:protein translocase subunit SecD [Coraliihabitans acroporae]